MKTNQQPEYLELEQRLATYQEFAINTLKGLHKYDVKGRIRNMRANAEKYEDRKYFDIKDIYIIGVNPKSREINSPDCIYQIGYIVKNTITQTQTDYNSPRYRQIFTGKDYISYLENGVIDFSTLVPDLKIVRSGLIDQNIGIDSDRDLEILDNIKWVNESIRKLGFKTKIDTAGNILIN